MLRQLWKPRNHSRKHELDPYGQLQPDNHSLLPVPVEREPIPAERDNEHGEVICGHSKRACFRSLYDPVMPSRASTILSTMSWTITGAESRTKHFFATKRQNLVLRPPYPRGQWTMGWNSSLSFLIRPRR